MLKVSFVVHSTIHLQKMLLGKLSVFCIRYFSKTKCKPAKKITGQCFSTQVKAACTHSANLERETEITKIVTYPPFPLASSNITSEINGECQNKVIKSNFNGFLRSIRLIIAIFKKQDNLKENILPSKFILMTSVVSLSSS